MEKIYVIQVFQSWLENSVFVYQINREFLKKDGLEIVIQAFLKLCFINERLLPKIIPKPLMTSCISFCGLLWRKRLIQTTSK